MKKNIEKNTRSVLTGPVLAAVFLSMALLSIGAGNALGEEQEFTSSTHGDWVLQCPKKKDPKVERPCTLSQSIMAEKTKSPLAIIRFVYVGEPPALHIVLRLPLGIALPPGISIRIDKGETSKWRFNHCEPGGCLVMSKVSPDLQRRLQAGKKAHIGFHTLAGKKVTVPASLRGITAGLRALMK